MFLEKPFETPKSLINKLKSCHYPDPKLQKFHEVKIDEIKSYLLFNGYNPNDEKIIAYKIRDNQTTYFQFAFHLLNETFNIFFNVTRIDEDINNAKLKYNLTKTLIDLQQYKYTIPEDYDNSINYGSSPIISTLIPDFETTNPQKSIQLIIDGNHRAHNAFLSKRRIKVNLTRNLSNVHFGDMLSFIFYSYLFEIHTFYLRNY